MDIVLHFFMENKMDSFGDLNLKKKLCYIFLLNKYIGYELYFLTLSEKNFHSFIFCKKSLKVPFFTTNLQAIV